MNQELTALWDEVALEIGTEIGGEVTPESIAPLFDETDEDGRLARDLPDVEAKLRSRFKGVEPERITASAKFTLLTAHRFVRRALEKGYSLLEISQQIASGGLSGLQGN